MSKQVEIKWLSEPEEHNYPAALAYLCLLYDEQTAVTHVDKLKPRIDYAQSTLATKMR